MYCIAQTHRNLDRSKQPRPAGSNRVTFRTCSRPIRSPRVQRCQSQHGFQIPNYSFSFLPLIVSQFSSSLIQLQHPSNGTMGTNLAELRQLKAPQGIQKEKQKQKQKHTQTQKHRSGPSWTLKNTACQACHARKKRCVTAPTYHRCTYCYKEGQKCLPWERRARYGSVSILKDKASELMMLMYPVFLCRDTQNQSDNDSNDPRRHGFDLPLPHGIDHEVPRWSAVYSLFSEVLRLLPSDETEIASDSNPVSPAEKECDGDMEDSGHRHSTPSHGGGSSSKNTRIGKGNGIGSEIHDQPNSDPSQGAVTNEEGRLSGSGSIAPGLCLGELDALLRF